MRTNKALAGFLLIFGVLICYPMTRGGQDIEMLSKPGKTPFVPVVEPLLLRPGHQWEPSVWGEWIVFDDNRYYQDLYPNTPMGWDVFAYNMVTQEEIRITSNYTYNPHYPQIYQNKIVYTNDISIGHYNVYIYDLITHIETPITNLVGYRRFPSIWQDKIVWMDERGPSLNYCNIFLYDLATGVEKQITNDLWTHDLPSINGNIIVWVDYRTWPNCIYAYDLRRNVEFQISTPAWGHTNPRIFNKKIVWQDQRYGTDLSAVFLYDVATKRETQITESSGICGSPVIYGDNIVYANYALTQSDIFLYNIKNKSTTRITDHDTTQSQPDFDGNFIIWLDYRNGIPDIYGAKLFR